MTTNMGASEWGGSIFNPTINRSHIDSVLTAYRMYATAASYPQHAY